MIENDDDLYFKTHSLGRYGSLQLELYDMLRRYKAAIGKDIDEREEE